MEIEMKIKGLMVDPVTNMPIVILKDERNDRVLPIWVGIFEANAIALLIEEIETPRPMTHDLLCNVLDSLQASVKKIVVSELKDNTYFAQIHLDVDGVAREIDARPSDAIALQMEQRKPVGERVEDLREPGVAAAMNTDNCLPNGKRRHRSVTGGQVHTFCTEW